YRTRSEPVDVPSAGASPVRRLVRLEIDPTDPHWPRQPPEGGIWIAAAGGFAAGPTLASSPSARCPAGCLGPPFPRGGVFTVRPGYRLPMGVSIEVEAGYLALSSAFSHSEHQSFTSTADQKTYPIRYQFDDRLSFNGPFLGGGASYR